MSYTESEAYQREIAEQYKERNLELKPVEVRGILSQLGIEVDEADIHVAEAGNMNATFVAGEYVVKVSNKEDLVSYGANVIVSKQLVDEKAIKVVEHDVREKTGYEVLVMERAPGTMWLPAMPEMSEEENKRLFAEVLKVVKATKGMEATEKFGWVNDIIVDPEKDGFDTHPEQLEARLSSYLRKIEVQTDLDQEAVSRLAAYVRERLDLFSEDIPSFVHTDLHMGNIMQQDGELTAVIDWDSAQSAPTYRGMVSLIGLIDNPAQFVEGTPDYSAYKDKKFEYLYPLLKSVYAEELADPKLAEKLNVMGIIDGLMWVADDWSKEWSKEMIANLVAKELTVAGDMSQTYYGQVLEKMKKA